jgi:hypothetical protein
MKTIRLSVAPAPARERAVWRVLYNGYAEFHKMPMTGDPR